MCFLRERESSPWVQKPVSSRVDPCHACMHTLSRQSITTLPYRRSHALIDVLCWLCFPQNVTQSIWHLLSRLRWRQSERARSQRATEMISMSHIDAAPCRLRLIPIPDAAEYCNPFIVLGLPDTIMKHPRAEWLLWRSGSLRTETICRMADLKSLCYIALKCSAARVCIVVGWEESTSSAF